MNAEKTVESALSMAEKTSVSIEILITGFVVVFAVLVLLILLISVYGTIVSKAEKAIADKKAAKEEAEKSAKEAVKVADVSPVQAPAPVAENGLTDEVIAVIAAAVDAMYGQGTVKVKSIKRVPQSRPVWSTAGIMDNTRPF